MVSTARAVPFNQSGLTFPPTLQRSIRADEYMPRRATVDVLGIGRTWLCLRTTDFHVLASVYDLKRQRGGR